MASYNNRPICFLMIFHVIFLTTSVVLSRNDDETNLLEGLNSYRSSIKVPPLTKNKQATCLATELADDEFKNRECVATKAENAIPANSGSQFAGYGKLLKKCHILQNTTGEGIILPVCVKKLVPELILTNYTRTGYAKYVNNSRFSGAGIGSDDDWVVLILSTTTPGGSLASHAPTLAYYKNNFILCFLPYLVMLALAFFLV